MKKFLSFALNKMPLAVRSNPPGFVHHDEVGRGWVERLHQCFIGLGRHLVLRAPPLESLTVAVTSDPEIIQPSCCGLFPEFILR